MDNDEWALPTFWGFLSGVAVYLIAASLHGFGVFAFGLALLLFVIATVVFRFCAWIGSQ